MRRRDRELDMLAQARAEAERARKAETERAAADEARVRAEDALDRLAREKADALDRLAREKADAEQASARNAQERAAADAMRAAAERAKSEAEQATGGTSAAEGGSRRGPSSVGSGSGACPIPTPSKPSRTKRRCARRLREQLNIILQTRESARGLIVNHVGRDCSTAAGRRCVRGRGKNSPRSPESCSPTRGSISKSKAIPTPSAHPTTTRIYPNVARLRCARSCCSRASRRVRSSPRFGKEQPVATNRYRQGRSRIAASSVVSGSPIQ